MAEVIVAKRTYILIWAALMCLTAITAAVSRVNLGPWSAPVALTIAVLKASLVVFFFMHLRYQSLKMIWIVVLAGVFWLFILMGLSMSDYLTRMWIGTPGK